MLCEIDFFDNDEFIKRDQEVYRLNCIIESLLDDVKQLHEKREKVKLHANDLLKEKDREVKQLTEELDEKQLWIRANQKTIRQMIGEINQFKDVNCEIVTELKEFKKKSSDHYGIISSQVESLNEQDERITELRRQRNLLYKYAEIHGDKFFLYAPLEKEYRDLLNEIEAEEDALYQ